MIRDLRPVELSLTPSKILLFWIFGIHWFCSVALLSMGHVWYWLLVLQGSVVISLALSYRYWKLGFGQKLIYDKDRWVLVIDNSNKVNVELYQSYQLGLLWVVVFWCRDNNKKIAIPLLPDSGSTNELRHFKQLLLFAGLPSDK